MCRWSGDAASPRTKVPGAGRSGRHRQSHDRAPGQVIEALAVVEFAHLGRAGLLHVADPRHAVAQFAYLGAPCHRTLNGLLRGR